MNNVMKLGQNCEDTLRRMDLYVDHELQEADAGRLLEHLESCPSCREELELRRRLRTRLRTAASAAPSPFLHTKVLAGVRSEAARQGRRSWFRWQSLTAAAAILGVTVVTATIAYQVGLAIERARIAGERAGLARAEERARIAREIHDTLAQDLTAIALHLEGALPHLERDPARARERLQRALSLTRTGLEEARRAGSVRGTW